jgi:hypothetical protein
MAPKTGPQPHQTSIYSYYWVCWPQRQDPFSHPHFAARERLVIFDNEAFRTTTWYRGPAENLKPHFAYAAGAFLPTTDRTQIEWTPGVPELRARQAAPGELEVELRSATPNFDTYLIRIDDGEPVRCDEGRYRWKLHAGRNTLSVRTCNLFGIQGPQVAAEVTYQP